MTAIMQNFSYAASFASFLFACHLWSARSAFYGVSVILGAYFLVLSIQTALLSLVLEFGRDHWWAFIRPSLAMTLGPIAWMYFTCAANDKFKVKPLHYLHFLPAMLICHELLTHTFNINIDMAIVASFAVYTAAVGRKLLAGPAQFAGLGIGARHVYRWLLIAVVLLCVLLVTEVAVIADLQRGQSISQSIGLLTSLVFHLLFLGCVLLAALRRPSPFDWMYETQEVALASNSSRYTQAEYQDCVERFEAMVEREKLYTDEAGNLSHVAKRLGVPARLLSGAINRTYGEGYARRMNRLRVNAAIRLLSDHPEMPLAQVMFDAGFRTKSSFNKEFRAITGKAPSDFRQTR